MFERFSENARQVVVLAQEEARTLNHAYIGSEHLLLGVARNEEGRGSAFLVRFGIVAEGLREEVVRTVGRGEEPPRGAIPFTRGAREALESALRVAISFHDGILGSEHLLLALAGWMSQAEPRPTSAEILGRLGLNADNLAQAVLGAAADPSRVLRSRRWTDRLERLSRAPVRTDELVSALELAIDLAEEEAIYFGRPDADSGDLLVGLIGGGSGIAGRALAALGVDADAAREAVERVRGEGGTAGPDGEPPVD